jgi:hypothetical protein
VVLHSKACLPSTNDYCVETLGAVVRDHALTLLGTRAQAERAGTCASSIDLVPGLRDATWLAIRRASLCTPVMVSEVARVEEVQPDEVQPRLSRNDPPVVCRFAAVPQDG